MKFRNLVVALLVVMLALAACGQNGEQPTQEPEAEEPQAEAPATEEPAEDETPAEEAESEEAAAEEGPVRLGVSTPLSGGAANLGQHERMGAELAAQEINAQGGVLGQDLELIVQDNGCNPSEGANSALSLINDSSVSGIIGFMCSSVTLAAMPVVQREEIPLLVDISTSPDITEQAGVGGNEWTFRINPSDAALAPALASFLSDQGTESVAIVGEDTDYGHGGAEALTTALENAGIEVVSTDFIAQGVADVSTLLTRLRSSQPDAVALYVLGADQLTFLRQAQSFDLDIPVTGRVEFSGDHLEILTSYGGFESSSSIFPYSHLVETEANQQFVEAFREEYDEDPIYQSFEGYQAVYLFVEAIERAGSTDPEAIRNTLEETDTESMLGGQIQFDEHNQAHDVAVILQIVDGEPVVADTVDTSP